MHGKMCGYNTVFNTMIFQASQQNMYMFRVEYDHVPMS
jgi:hypothetical protein